MLKSLLKAAVLIALISGAFFGGYVFGLFDQESSVAWREASYATSSLREIREKRPDRAVLLLETRLDYHLMRHAQFDIGPRSLTQGLARRLRPFPEEAMRDGIRHAAKYRSEFPSPERDEQLRALVESVAQRYR